MEQPLTPIGTRAFLELAAGAILGREQPDGTALGDIMLQQHQQDATRLLLRIIRRHRGAILADDVGLGKTYVALALARELNAAPLVVAPAVLRDMWLDAFQRSGVQGEFCSVETASRGARLPAARDFIVVDEAHALRNPRTRRYRRIVTMAAHSRILLVTATPVHNHERELRALLSIFLGAPAATLRMEVLGRYIVRRARDHVRRGDQGPVIVHAPPIAIRPREELLDALMALPPAVPPRDGGDGGALVAYGLVRLWASSGAALVAALRRRLARGIALQKALLAGVHPTASELRSWCVGDDAVQLPLFGVFHDMRDIADGDESRRMALANALETHLSALRDLLPAALRSGAACDVERAEKILHIRKRHAHGKLVAFTQFAATARSLYSQLAPRGRCGLLHSAQARIASGRITRSELLRLFAPAAHHAAVPSAHQRVDTLFSTDVLSEGVNLQDASVVVHLDLPWTPTRLAQRVGRVARHGSAHSEVVVYTLAPPASAEALLRVERRLSAKLAVAARSVGTSSTVLPMLHLPTPSARSTPELQSAIRSLLRKWRSAACCASRAAGGEGMRPAATAGVTPTVAIPVASTHCGVSGFLALVDDEESFLVRGTASSISRAPDAVLQALLSVEAAVETEAERATGPSELAAQPASCHAMLAALQRWLARAGAAEDAGVLIAPYAVMRRRLLRRIDAIASTAAPHLRPRVALLAARARQAALVECGAGGEEVLSELAAAPMADEAWLLALTSFGEAQGALGEQRPAGRKPRIAALLVLEE